MSVNALSGDLGGHLQIPCRLKSISFSAWKLMKWFKHIATSVLSINYWLVKRNFIYEALETCRGK